MTKEDKKKMEGKGKRMGGIWVWEKWKGSNGDKEEIKGEWWN